MSTQSEAIVTPETKTAGSPSARSLFRNQNFRFLWAGEAISLLGDQFHLIAMPWLVLQLTGDPLAMGAALALAGIPRAIFMLVGGAFTDRFSPRTVMLVSNLARMALVLALAALIFTGRVELWMVYVLTLGFGLMDAFFFPAQSAIIPRLVSDEQLPPANSIMQGTLQLSSFAGPVLAGYLIAVLSTTQTDGALAGAESLRGLSLAFVFDALTFLVSAITLWMIRLDQSEEKLASQENTGLLHSIRELLTLVWNDIALRTFFILIAISNFLIMGPIMIGIPILADTRFPEGAAAFGIIMSAYGGGSLVGIAFAGLLPRPPAQRMGLILGIIWSSLGLGVLALGLAQTTIMAALVALLMGAANGYVVILFITWLQTRTQKDMLGRMMSLLMFASAGLIPISTMLTGAIIGTNPVALFVISGLLMTVITLVLLFNPSIRSMEEGPAPTPAMGD